MLCRVGTCVAVSVAVASALCRAALVEAEVVPAVIVRSPEASFAEALAAKEIRRYVYLRSGKLLPIVEGLPAGGGGGLIVVGSKGRPAVRAVLSDERLKAAVQRLAPQQYLLKTIEHEGRPIVLVAGGDAVGTLYGAYRLAEHLGVRFYLHGDVIPDRQMALELPTVDEWGKPLFDRRGIQPFHDFPEGPDWWNTDDYKMVLAQLPKLRMNFFGLHTYPEGRVGPEPTVWIGRPADVDPEGRVRFSYPSRHFTTRNQPSPGQGPAWGYQPIKTRDYRFGAAEIFDRDDYAADYMQGMSAWTEMSPEACNELFERMGSVLREAFTFAGRLGIKTCLGTETPLVIPTPVNGRLVAAGKDPADPAVVQELYEGIFRRIMKTHPLDYYWFWTPENWTWRPVNQKQIEATMADFRAAMAAAEKVHVPFTLATCGWVLGPQQDRALFDNTLPKTMPMSCINRNVGHDPVEPGFAAVRGRPQWAIPWLEDDPAMIIPQLWVGRMRKDAVDALRYGCTGLLGIHWRTRILGPNVAALAHAAWDQTGWGAAAGGAVQPDEQVPPQQRRNVYQPERHAPGDDFYADWARQHFGPEAGEPIGRLLASLDGRLPRPSTWVQGPGGIKPDDRPWEEVRKEYAFVDDLAVLRANVTGAGNLARFDYWLDNFRYLRAVGQVGCTWARFNKAMKKVKAEKDTEARRRLARQTVLPIRKELVAAVAEAHRYLLATVSTPGAMGNVANWQQHIMPTLLTAPGEELAEILGEPLPTEAMPAGDYQGPPRLFLPTVRTCLVAGERLRLTVVVQGASPPEVAVYWRPLGSGQFAGLPLEHVARGIYKATLPPQATAADLEYYVRAATAEGPVLKFPPTAPTLNQTVVVVEER